MSLFPLPLVLCELTFFSNRPFPSCTKPPFQSEVKGKAIYMKMTFILLQILSLVLKVKVFELRNGLLYFYSWITNRNFFGGEWEGTFL